MWVRKVRKSFADNLTLLRIFFSIEILATIQFRFWAEKRKSSLQKTFRSKTKTNKQKQFCTKTRKDNICFCKSVKCTHLVIKLAASILQTKEPKWFQN
jgi:hypothetical protein